MGDELTNWIDPAMYQSEEMVGDGPRVYLINATPDPLGTIAAGSMMYEGKVARSLSVVNDEMRRHYWGESLKTHLNAILEFVDFHFLIEGVTRAFTHQLVRQRTAVYIQESMRFAVKGNLDEEVPLPPSIKEGTPAAEAWQRAVENIGEVYDVLINRENVPAEDARGLLPHSTLTRIHYKTSLRNLIPHMGNRLCTQAQFEWRAVINELVRTIANYESPADIRANGSHVSSDGWQWKTIAGSELFRPVCYQIGHCPYGAKYDRSCTIKDRVERGEFDKIDPAEWMLDPAAARR